MLTLKKKTPSISLYELGGSSLSDVREFLVSTGETRQICNDSLCVGLEYTELLKQASVETFRVLPEVLPFGLSERTSVVLNVLRGGLNFGIREALGQAFGWNTHGSAFISAQRARKSNDFSKWYITESSYQKVFLPDNATLIFGDVVATGTSLEYAVDRVLSIAKEERVELGGIIFLTVGGSRASEIIKNADKRCRLDFPRYRGSMVVYFEGQFSIATNNSPVKIKIDGTDLLRRDSILTQEFIESQYQDPTYPIERCTIYDAGSRSFRVGEYLEDLTDYWSKTLELAQSGVSYKELLNSRFPELSVERFGEVILSELCKKKLESIKRQVFKIQEMVVLARIG